MATNFKQPGDVLDLAAPYDVASGGGFLVGSLFAVALGAAANGAPVRGMTTGVFDLPKAPSQAWTVGARIFWDDTEKRCTTAHLDNTPIGLAVAAVADGAGDTIGRVKLVPNMVVVIPS